MKTNKSEVVEAGKELASRSTPAQQENHTKVLGWVGQLSDEQIPDYHTHAEGRKAGALLSYKMLIRTWYQTFVQTPKN